jgi:hypothetical protein
MVSAIDVHEAFFAAKNPLAWPRAKIAYLWLGKLLSDAEAVRLLRAVDQERRIANMPDYRIIHGSDLNPPVGDEGIVDWDELMATLGNLPMTWIPAITTKLIAAGYDKKVWNGSAMKFLEKADARVRSERGIVDDEK